MWKTLQLILNSWTYRWPVFNECLEEPVLNAKLWPQNFFNCNVTINHNSDGALYSLTFNFTLDFLIFAFISYTPPQSWGGNSTVIRAPLFVRLSVLLSVRDGFFGTFLLSPWPNLTHYHTSPTECLWVKDVQSTLTLNHVSRFKVKFIANPWPFTHLEYKYIIVFSCIFYTCYINKKVILIELQFACLKLGKNNIYNRI